LTSGSIPGVVLTLIKDQKISRIFNLLLQKDRKIIALGAAASDSFAMARYHYNGSLDDSFNPNGQQPGVVSDYGLAYGKPFLQDDGNVVIALSSNGTSRLFTLVRYKAIEQDLRGIAELNERSSKEII
jgi:hypothetical protein